MTHTPGPWFGKENEGVFTDIEHETPVFETGCGCCSSSRLSKADACLIERSPELLAFARWCRDGQQQFGDAASFALECHRRASDLVAKAEGTWGKPQET